jgi:hypothetical protein
MLGKGRQPQKITYCMSLVTKCSALANLQIQKLLSDREAGCLVVRGMGFFLLMIEIF